LGVLGSAAIAAEVIKHEALPQYKQHALSAGTNDNKKRTMEAPSEKSIE
jgi:hypothetical protein